MTEKAKKQVYRITLNTTDEELNGEILISDAIMQYKSKNEKRHIQSVEVESLSNEWESD